MSLFEYRDKARELIYQYKFKGRCMLARLFARRIYHMYCTYFPDCGVIPIPSSFIKRRKRGWDHIGFITDILAKTYHLPVYCVLKKHHTRDQKDLPYRDRLTNIKGTISVAQKHHNLPEHVVLIDDVFTTGGTVSECSRVLLDAGVESVSSITIAID
jgi:ComF family protein